MKIKFATTNKEKVKEANKIGKKYGIKFKQLSLDWPEPRSDQLSLIVKKGATYCFKKIRKPLVTEDSGLFIEELNGFPVHLIYDLVPLFRVASHAQSTKLSSKARKRLKWMDYYRKCHNLSQTCRHFGISRKTLYYWLKRWDPRNLASLEERDRTPRKKRQREISSLQEQRIISLRKKYLIESKFNIAIYYQREHKEPISSWKVQKVIEKYHLYHHPQKAAKIRNKRQRGSFKEKNH